MKVYARGSSGTKYVGKYLKIKGYKVYYISHKGKIKTIHKDNVVFDYKLDYDPI